MHPTNLLSLTTAPAAKPTTFGFLIVLGFCVLTYVAPLLNWLALVPFFFVASISQRHTAIAIIVCWLPSSLGGALHPWMGVKLTPPPSDLLQTVRWLLTGWCLLLSLIRTSNGEVRDADFSFFIAVYAAILLTIALLTSELPRTSFSRVAAWAVGLFSIHQCFLQLNQKDRFWAFHFFLGAISATILLSLLLQGFPGARLGIGGFLRGIYIQSQALGPIAGSIAAYFVCQQLLTPAQEGKFQVGKLMILACMASLYLSHSRTAMLALLLGTATALVLYRNQGAVRINHSAVTVYAFIGGLLLAIILAADTGLIESFVAKYDTSTTDVDKSLSIRSGLIGKQLGAFLSYPVFGTGFGLPALNPSDFRMAQAQGGLSFTTEKGFLPTAILQETGLVGALMFFALLWTLVRRFSTSPDPRLVAAACTSLFSNLGEATFFSLGGVGFYHWLWIILALQTRPVSLTSGVKDPVWQDAPNSILREERDAA